jgi:hypothetical protein
MKYLFLFFSLIIIYIIIGVEPKSIPFFKKKKKKKKLILKKKKKEAR